MSGYLRYPSTKILTIKGGREGREKLGLGTRIAESGALVSGVVTVGLRMMRIMAGGSESTPRCQTLFLELCPQT